MRNSVLLLSMVGCQVVSSAGASAQGLEDIRVVRSVRVSRMQSTEFCAQSRTTFAGAQYEDRYSFAAVATRPADGAVTDAASAKVGSGHGCLGSTDKTGVLNIYLEIELSGIQFTGIGKCTTGKSDSPEPGVLVLSCFANVSGVAAPYVGGLLTTNTLTSRSGGADSDPPGYIQASIATIRLWKRRDAAR